MTTPTIQLANGQFFDLVGHNVDVLDIDLVAHALANLCRFTGHTRHFYSVAQHSVLASYLVPEEDAKAALLHDAPEILIGDLSRPLQRLLPDYCALKATIEAKFFQHFGLPAKLPDSVKRADMIMLATEKRDLMPSIATDREHWGALLDLEPMAEHIVPVGPPLAYVLFMRRWRELQEASTC